MKYNLVTHPLNGNPPVPEIFPLHGGLKVKLNLQFFADDDKTEEPTAKKREKARDEGQVAKSVEIGTAFLFIVSFFSLRLFAKYMYESIVDIFVLSAKWIGSIDDIQNIPFMAGLVTEVFSRIILIVMPIFAVVIAVGVTVNLIQVKWHPTTKPLQPKFSRLNPVQGAKRLFSAHSLMELLKSIVKIAIISFVMYNSIKKELHNIPLLIHMEVAQAILYIGNLIIDLGITVGMYFIFLAAADYAFQKYKHHKSLKMTKQEVKDEYKMSEGDPAVKGKIKSKMREISTRRMMQQLPKADVIITNPTHFAVALLYDRIGGSAPKVIAKGTDFLAQRIKNKAKECHIEIVENKQLARTLYNTVEIGQEIPPELYQAVAEILAYVYNLKNMHHAV